MPRCCAPKHVPLVFPLRLSRAGLGRRRRPMPDLDLLPPARGGHLLDGGALATIVIVLFATYLLYDAIRRRRLPPGPPFYQTLPFIGDTMAFFNSPDQFLWDRYGARPPASTFSTG